MLCLCLNELITMSLWALSSFQLDQVSRAASLRFNSLCNIPHTVDVTCNVASDISYATFDIRHYVTICAT